MRKYVTGIFEASVLASLSLIDSTSEDETRGRGDGPSDGGREAGSFGIVSTGAVWEVALKLAGRNFWGPP